MNRRNFLWHLPGWAGVGAWGWAPSPVAAAPARAGSDGLAADSSMPAVAFFYGAQPPWDELRLFDWVVLEPTHALASQAAPEATLGARVLAFAYVSLGEVDPTREYAAAVPSAWVRGRNEAWRSWVIDQTAPGWRAFFLERVIAPLWAAGFRA